MSKKYYREHSVELRKKRKEKYYESREAFVFKINDEYFSASINKEKYNLNDNIKKARIFYSRKALFNIIHKYNINESEVVIFYV